jgi:hypothetical protein
MVHEGVMRRSDDAFSAEISRGMSADAMCRVSSRLVRFSLEVLFGVDRWCWCRYRKLVLAVASTIAHAVAYSASVGRVYFDGATYHVAEMSCVRWSCSTGYAANDVLQHEIRASICSH